MNFTFQLAEINQIAAQILTNNPQKVILFYGNMGTGKTTLIKALCHQLGVLGNTNSPTFSIVNEYQTNNSGLIYHFDMYRLKNQQEAIDFGFDDYLYSENWCFIEWPEKIPNLLPEKYSIIEIVTNNDNSRTLTLK